MITSRTTGNLTGPPDTNFDNVEIYEEENYQEENTDTASLHLP